MHQILLLYKVLRKQTTDECIMSLQLQHNKCRTPRYHAGGRVFLHRKATAQSVAVVRSGRRRKYIEMKKKKNRRDQLS